MRETVVIKYFLIVAMILMAVFSFYEMFIFNDVMYKFIIFLAGCFFVYEAIRIFTLKAK